MFNLSFFGLGYVGLTTATCFASRGFKVTCFDTNKENLSLIKTGKSPFYEKDLDKILTKTLDDNLLKCTFEKTKAVLESDITFITVGTPNTSGGSIDLTQVKEASKGIGEALNRKHEWHLVVVKSTVVPDTTENIVKPLLEKYSKKHLGSGFGLCFNPEFLREGTAIYDTFNPDRVVIGECDEKSGRKLKNIYKVFYGDMLPPLIRTTPVNAELIKYANNAFLSMKISFINMIANLTQKLPNADVEEIAQGIGLDKRIEARFLKAGAGWGGSCFKKDLDAIKAYGEKLNVKLPLIEATLEINEERPLRVIELIRELLGDLHFKQIGVLGLSFKPDTSDMREAVSIKVINQLLKEGAIVKAYDPAAIDTAKKIFHEKIGYMPSIQECLKDTDCIVILTEWNEFKKLKPDVFVKFMKEPVIVDGRRIFDPKIYSNKSRFKAIGLGK